MVFYWGYLLIKGKDILLEYFVKEEDGCRWIGKYSCVVDDFKEKRILEISVNGNCFIIFFKGDKFCSSVG